MSFPDLLLEAFISWLWLFGAPIRDANILWIIVPIWVSWFFTEFFQEKKGTGFGNAITNGGVSLWVAIDWTRHLTYGISRDEVTLGLNLYIKFALCAFVLIYGIVVIVKGLKGKKFASIGGRIRVITYILVMFSPFIYDTAQINLMNIISIFAFFPLFYFLLELIDKIVPDSKALEIDKSKSDDSFDSHKDLHKENDPFASSMDTKPESLNDSNLGQPTTAPTGNPFSDSNPNQEANMQNLDNNSQNFNPSQNFASNDLNSQNIRSSNFNGADNNQNNQNRNMDNNSNNSNQNPFQQSNQQNSQPLMNQQNSDPDFERLPDREKRPNPFD